MKKYSTYAYAYGQPSKCTICKSIFHWDNNCPECRLPETSTQNKAENITLFTESVQRCYVENVLGETLSNAILDSGCTQTVCGESCLHCYIDTLCESDRNSIETSAVKRNSDLEMDKCIHL